MTIYTACKKTTVRMMIFSVVLSNGLSPVFATDALVELVDDVTQALEEVQEVIEEIVEPTEESTSDESSIDTVSPEALEPELTEATNTTNTTPVSTGSAQLSSGTTLGGGFDIDPNEIDPDQECHGGDCDPEAGTGDTGFDIDPDEIDPDQGCHGGDCDTCGDGTQDEGEACDDGNTESNDGCSSTCELEYQRCTWTFQCAWSPYEAGDVCTTDTDCTTRCTDTDNDTICDVVDNCVDIANTDQANSDDDVFGDVCDICVDVTNPNQDPTDNDANGTPDECEEPVCDDTDGDGVCDPIDNCVDNVNPDQTNSDDDAFGDACDICVLVTNPAQDPTDNNSNGIADECEGIGCTDTDLDGICDTIDNCVDTPNPDQTNSDGDAFGDACDICPDFTNPNQDPIDTNNDGTPDECEDTGCVDEDDDGICDSIDNCLDNPNPDQADTDGDGIGDACDNCVDDANPGQEDENGYEDNAGEGDACEEIPNCYFEGDTDNDGVCDPVDNCIDVPNPDQMNSDDDVFGDVCDICVLVTNPNQDPTDNDTNGIPDECEDIVNADYDLALQKDLLTSGVINPGDPVVFQITVTNQGDENAGGISVIDYTPNGLNFVSASLPANNTAAGVIVEVGNIIIGQSVTFTITYEVDTNFSGGTIINWAEILSDNGDDVDSTPGNGSQNEDDDDNALLIVQPACIDNDNDDVCDTIDNCLDNPNTDQADTDGDGVGDACDNCVDIVNPGQEDENGYQDNTGAGDACEQIPVCYFNGGDTDGDGVCDPVDNCVYVPNTDQADDNNDGEGNACDVYDLSLQKTLQGTQTVFESGDTVSFLIRVTNEGDINASNVSVTDYVPAGLTAVSATTVFLGDIAVGETVTTTIVMTVDANAPDGTIMNWAEILSDNGDDIDSTPGNGSQNEDDDDNAVITIDNNTGGGDDYDLALSKTRISNEVVSVGDTVVFNVTVTNEGDEDASNIVITDYVPVGLTPTGVNGTVNGAGNLVYTFEGVTLIPGATTSVQLSFLVNTDATGTIVNWAEITDDNGNDSDSITNNGSQNEDDDDNAFVTVDMNQPTRSDPAITVSGPATNNNNLVCGDIATYTAIISNTQVATADAEGVVATIDVPFGNIILNDTVVVTTASGDTMTCSVVNNDQLVCNGDVAIGNDVLVTFDVQLANCACEAAYTFAIEGNVSAINGDMNLQNNYDIFTNNVASDETCGGGGDDDYDLALSKTLVGVTEVNVGDTVVFNVTVTNEGDEDASNIVITDYVPVGLTPTGVNGTVNAAGNIVYSFEGVTLIPGATASVELSFLVNADATGTMTNWAEITDDNGNDSDSTTNNGSQNEDDDDSAFVRIDDGTGGSCTDPITNLQITNFVNNQSVASGAITLAGVYSGNALQVEVSVNGTTTIAQVVGTTFTADIVLATGTNNIIVTALSSDSNCTEQLPFVLTFEEVCEDAGLVITAPVTGTSTRSRVTTVVGSVTNTGATVTINGDEVVVAADGSFSQEVVLNVGSNDIVIVSTTPDGCVTTQTLQVTRTTGGGGGGGTGSGNYCGDNVIRSSEQCDDGNAINGDGCSASCEIEDDDIIEEIKKKKIIELIKRRPEPYQFPEPAILAPTGHTEDVKATLQFILQAYHNQ